MEDPITYDHPQNDVVYETVLPITPLENNDYLLFPDHADVTNDVSFDLDFPVNVDFTFDDLSFADDLLLEQPDPILFSSVNPNLDDLGENRAIDDEIRVFDCSIVEANSSEGSNCNSGVNGGNSCDRDVFSSINCVSDDIVKVVKVDQDNVSNYNSCNEFDSSGSVSKCVLKSKRKKEVEHDNGGGIRVSKCVVKSKRKKDVECDDSGEIRVSKVRKSNASIEGITSEENVENVEGGGGEGFSLGGGDDDERRKTRLLRNRESAHLLRQRKKKYVEELEDKVRGMVSMITDLNGRISYFMSENATLRQQLCGGVGAPPSGAVPGMMPMPYHWMPCHSPYMMNPSGSSVPLVPIPRLKPQQPLSAPKVKKSSEGKKGKTKKVASVSLIGLLFFMVLFGGLVPMVNVRYGRNGDGDGDGDGDGVEKVHKGAVFKVDRDKETMGNGDGKFGHGRVLQQSNISNGGNGSEPLEASLYVPRNEKLIKIDGNLIIHSVLASEKAIASQTTVGGNTSEETGLAIHGSYPPYPTPGPGSNNWRRPHLDRNQNERQMALGSGSANGFTPIESDGKLQQWFREGLAGPMLSSEMCTEVFQFDVSPSPGSIVPATSAANITSEDRLNSTHPNKTKNRRILHGRAIPLKDHTINNTTNEQVQPQEQNDVLESNKSRSSVVVSVLVDPREIDDGVIGSKSLSRIFVVVLLDSVKYVTYSCMLPFMGSSSPLITT